MENVHWIVNSDPCRTESVDKVRMKISRSRDYVIVVCSFLSDSLIQFFLSISKLD